MADRKPADRLGTAVDAAVITALTVWFGVTVLSQHPNRTFDRLRRHDRFGVLIPNWRFFAPEPAQHDFHLLHRVQLADEGGTAWSETNPIAERSWRQSVWFPERRRDKAMFDLCAELIPRLGPADLDVTAVPAYRVLRDFVEVAVRREYQGRELPRGYQFVIVRGTGYDEEGEPEYVLVSPFHALGAA